jgi:hypothetical protein
MQNLVDVYHFFVTYVLPIIGAAAVAAAALPKGEPGTPWYYVRLGIDWLAANVGNAKNVNGVPKS